jgi:uncharacterized protein YkwD
VKALTWFGALVLFVAVAAGTASVLRPHSQSPATLTAGHEVASAAVPGSDAATVPQSPSAAPKPKPASKPAKPVRHAPAPAPRPAVTNSVVIVSTQQALINQDRARYGLAPLKWSSCLASIAYSNAVRMASQGYISHTNGASQDLGCHLGYHGGENVGYWSGGGLTQGQLDSKLNTMFMNSAGHRANILSPYYHYVGTAWRTAPNGAHYIAVEFS